MVRKDLMTKISKNTGIYLNFFKFFLASTCITTCLRNVPFHCVKSSKFGIAYVTGASEVRGGKGVRSGECLGGC